jgi:hypothetical protein
MLETVFFETNGVTCTYSGNANLQEILKAIAQYLTHPNCSGFKYIVHDFTRVESFTYLEEEFASLVTYAMKNYQDADYTPRCAVTQNDTVRRCLDLYAELTGRKWNFVPTLSAASEWANAR